MRLVNCGKQDKEDYSYLLTDQRVKCAWTDRQGWSESF